jgi:hypothetical protein
MHGILWCLFFAAIFNPVGSPLAADAVDANMDRNEQLSFMTGAVNALPAGPVRTAFERELDRLRSESGTAPAPTPAPAPAAASSTAATTDNGLWNTIVQQVNTVDGRGGVVPLLLSRPLAAPALAALAFAVHTLVLQATNKSVRTLSCTERDGAARGGFAPAVSELSGMLLPEDWRQTDNSHSRDAGSSSAARDTFTASYSIAAVGGGKRVKITLLCHEVSGGKMLLYGERRGDTSSTTSSAPHAVLELDMSRYTRATDAFSTDAKGIRTGLLQTLSPLQSADLIQELKSLIETSVLDQLVPATSPSHASEPSVSVPRRSEPPDSLRDDKAMQARRYPGHDDLMPDFSTAVPGGLFGGGGGNMGVGGGSWVGPDHPMFGNMGPDMGYPRPPGVPGGARYDPIMPPGIGGVPGPVFPGRGRGMGRGGGAPPPTGPTPDHLRPPPDGDFPPDIYW